MMATVGKKTPLLAVPEDPVTTFNDFLALCYAANLKDDDRIAYIEWDAGRPLKLKRLEAGIALVNGRF